MQLALSDSDKARLKTWIETSLASNTNSLAAGYQGQTLIYHDADLALVIKVPHGRGLIRKLHLRMLQHEYAVYQKLTGFAAAPKCYGMVDNQYLVLQYINGLPIRQQRPQHETIYFDQMLQAIQHMHELGVAHMDLKKKDNLLVVDNAYPYLIDFGAAVIYQPGFHPLNHFRYQLAVRFDYNAWIKHKYHDRIDEISDADRVFYKITLTEIVARKIKRFYRGTVLTFIHHFLK